MALAKKPFVILDAEILSSSVWSEAAHVRLVWITLLILCDTEGYVGASVPGIARAAGVSLDDAVDAMWRLQQPDPHSRTKACEGRRVEEVERGFRVLNFMEHLDRLSAERKKARDRVRRFRLKRKQACNVTETLQASEGGGTSEQGPAKNVRTDSVAVAPVESWSRQACDDWIDRYGGTAPGGQIGKALKPLVGKHGWPAVRQAWRSYLEQSDAEYASASRFAATYGRWSGAAPPGKAATVVNHNRAVLERFVKGGEAG